MIIKSNFVVGAPDPPTDLDQGFFNSKVVTSEGSVFVVAENIQSRHFLNGQHSLGDGTLQSSEQIQWYITHCLLFEERR